MQVLKGVPKGHTMAPTPGVLGGYSVDTQGVLLGTQAVVGCTLGYSRGDTRARTQSSALLGDENQISAHAHKLSRAHTRARAHARANFGPVCRCRSLSPL
jgi:hypothetical protein